MLDGLRLMVLGGSLAAVAGPALACSFAGADLFKPTLERFKEHPGAKQKGDKTSL